MKKEQQKKEKGFSLIETLVAVFIISVGVVAVFSMNYDNIVLSSSVANRLTATYLSQEGIEVVKNIRDTNFLINYQTATTNWYNGLTNCSVASPCEADYEDFTLLSYTGNPLNIDGNEFYSYNAGTPSIFTRKISIVPDNGTFNSSTQTLEILVTVSWKERGSSKEVTAQENLYNWWQ